MSVARLYRSKRFGKPALCLLLAVQVADPWMHARAGDSPIDYSQFHSAAEVREAAMKRVEQTIQASKHVIDISLEAVVKTFTPEARETPSKPLITASAPAAPRDAVMEQASGQTGSGSPQTQTLEPARSETAVAPDTLGGRLLALGDAALDNVRGGFDMPDSNLRYSFGIERAVYINGELMASTVLHLQDRGTGSGLGVSAQASAVANEAAATLGLIQNGPGNNFTAQSGPNTVGTVIQNTLDNQKIQSVTTINATVNSIQVMRAMSVQSAVQSGIISSLRN